MLPDLMTRDEVAKYLRVSPDYLDRTGTEGPPYVQVGLLIRYRRSDVEQWLSDYTVYPAAEIEIEDEPSAPPPPRPRDMLRDPFIKP